MTKAAYVTADAATFGGIIKRLRMSEGWTIAEFARRSGFTKSHLGLIERGKNIPSLDMLFTLSELFRIDAAGRAGATRTKSGARGGDAGGGGAQGHGHGRGD
jgi:transcriptional regulator with XRE-family HTH domain